MKHYSVLLSVFKRKGGEGVFTRIITPENLNNFIEPLSLIGKDERPLICYKKDKMEWLLLTDTRILQQNENLQIILPYSEIEHVRIALKEHADEHRKNHELFSLIEVKNVKGEKFIIRTEPGEPFRGIYQVLCSL